MIKKCRFLIAKDKLSVLLKKSEDTSTKLINGILI